MSQEPSCPKCNSEHTYSDGNLLICPECAHEWSPTDAGKADDTVDTFVVLDANGQVLQDGDSVTVIKDLKLKGSSSVVKVGSKAKNIRLVDSADGHNISCKIDGIGALNLKSEFVRKQ